MSKSSFNHKSYFVKFLAVNRIHHCSPITSSVSMGCSIATVYTLTEIYINLKLISELPGDKRRNRWWMLQNSQVPGLYAIVYPTSFDFIGHTRGNHQPMAKFIQRQEEIIYSCRKDVWLFYFAGGNYLLLLLKSLTPWGCLEEIFASQTSKGWVSHTKFCSGHLSVKVIVPSIGVPIIKINIEICIIKIRWSWDHFIFIMGIPILIFMILLTSWCEFLCVINITLLYCNKPLGLIFRP